MSETPGRRATRASVRGPSATPAPTAVRRPRAKTPKALAPLPAVPTGTSYAYGASGKVSLYTQVDSARAGTSFADRFGAGRETAVSRDDDSRDDDGVVAGDDVILPPVVTGGSLAPGRPSAGSSSSSSSSASSAVASAVSSAPSSETPYGRRRTPASSRRLVDSAMDYDADADHTVNPGGADDDDDDESGDSSGPTDMDTGFSYSGGPSGILVPPPTQAEVDAARPWSLAVLWETIRRWFRTITTPWRQLHPWLRTLLLAFTLATVVLFALTDFHILRDRVWDICHQAGGAVGNSLGSITSWTRGSRSPAAQDNNLVQRVRSIENDLMRLRRDTELDHDQIAILREYVPENAMIQKNKDTGEWELPLNFWNALREKLSEQGSSIAWETFIRTNQAKLDAAAKQAMEKASPYKQIITQEMVIEQVRKSKAEMEDGLQNTAARYAHAAAKRAVKDLVSASPAAERSIKELHNTAFAHSARNTELALYSVNYFSPGLGAIIDPVLSSTTYAPKQGGYWAQIGHSIYGQYPNPPSQALTSWAEATDCWCAAASNDKGKAQLAVIMPRHIVPTSVTIEHIPAQGTLSIGTAPREFEVWVGNVEKTIAPTPGSEHGLDGECGAPPEAGFVCIGKAHYDIHAPSHIQNFALEAGQAVGLVNKAIIRINNNWGKAHTCLYRIRFHGDAVLGPFDLEEA